MNKKMILTIVVLAFGALVAFGLFQASKLMSIQIVKSITVKGSKEKAFDMVRYLKNFPKWSPFLAQDPSQKYEVKGTDGAVGAQYHWLGNGGKDVGFQEIIKIDTFNFIGLKCDIQKPFVATPTFDYTFKETANGIEIVQDFKLQSELVPSLFMWIFGAKSQMEKTNQQGLDLLKIAIEN